MSINCARDMRETGSTLSTETEISDAQRRISCQQYPVESTWPGTTLCDVRGFQTGLEDRFDAIGCRGSPQGAACVASSQRS